MFHPSFFIKNKINGVIKRIRCLSFGIIYLRNENFKIPSILFINRKLKNFKFLNHDDHRFIYEFNEICLNDCYQIKLLKSKLKKVSTIVDIGCNQGLFSIAARNSFPYAQIYGYEPNPQLSPIVNHNMEQIRATIFNEAVTKETCKIKLNFGDTDLHTTAHESVTGDIIGTSFKTVVERIGKPIDILKIDCEGGEWELFEDRNSWDMIRSVTMEYHLWAKERSTIEMVVKILTSMNFIVINKEISDLNYGLITAIKE